MQLEANIESIEQICTYVSMPAVISDMVTSLIGEKLGAGVYRSTHVYNLDREKYVIKIEPLNTQCNVSEYLLWQEIKGLCGELAWVKDWFAPVKWISPCGRLLVMERTKPTSSKKKPEKVPKFLWDVKSDNFGWLRGKYVCHDYGSIYSFIQYKKGFTNVTWYD